MITQYKMEPNCHVYTSLIQLYAEMKDIKQCTHLFNSLLQKQNDITNTQCIIIQNTHTKINKHPFFAILFLFFKNM